MMRTCQECKREYDAAWVICPYCRVYTPTAEEIEEGCRVAQSQWSETVENTRRCVKKKPVEAEVWVVKLGRGIVGD